MGEEPSGTSVNKQKIYHIIVLTQRDTTRTALNFAVGMSQINGKNNFLHGTAISGTNEAPFHSIGDVQRRHIRTRFDFVMIFSRLIYSRFNKAIINLRSIIIDFLLMAYRAGKESIT